MTDDSNVQKMHKAPEIDTSAEAVGAACNNLELLAQALRRVEKSILASEATEASELIKVIAAERDALQAEVERLRQTVRDMDAAAEAEAQKYEDHFYGHDQTRGCIECGAELASPSDTVCPNCLRTASMTGLEGGE